MKHSFTFSFDVVVVCNVHDNKYIVPDINKKINLRTLPHNPVKKATYLPESPSSLVGLALNC